MGVPIYVGGGGNVTFFVADYFQGSVGSYLLDLQIVKGQNVSINNITTGSISVFPNPTYDVLFIDAGETKENYTMKIFNVIGEQVSESNGMFSGSLLKVDVSTLSPGVYTVQLKTESGIADSKFIVK